MQEADKRKKAEQEQKQALVDKVEHKKKLDAYVAESKDAFDEYYGLGVRPLCGDYLHDIAFQKSDKS